MSSDPAQTPAFAPRATLDEINALMADDRRDVDEIIRSRLSSDVALINQLGNYITGSGGKRVRPLVLLLAARACGYQGRHHIDLAAVIEFIHTATLLHDDVVDSSDLRRGQDTANALWGNEAAVLVGDFIYTRSFEMMVDVGSMRVMEILSHTTNAIAEGEVLQLINCHDPDTAEASYMEVIRRKTAKLFEAAARLGGVLAGATETQEHALAEYGMQLGTAFQLIDDALDFSASSDAIGKNVGDDLAEGKPTLPVIEAIRRSDTEQANILRAAISSGGRENIEVVTAAVESTGAIAYTARLAREEAGKAIKALQPLAESPHKEALCALAEFSANRSY